MFVRLAYIVGMMGVVPGFFMVFVCCLTVSNFHYYHQRELSSKVLLSNIHLALLCKVTLVTAVRYL